MEDLLKRKCEIEEAPETIYLNGIKYQKVETEKPKRTLSEVIKAWEWDFTPRWEKDQNKNCDFYNQEVNRLMSMILEILPEEKHIDISASVQETSTWCGWNAYRRTLISKFK